MRRSSPLLRSTKALVGLVTIWCLGCSSYESILTSLFGMQAAATMTCDSGMGADSDRVAMHAASANERSAPAVSVPRDARGFDCGCGRSCHAPAPHLAVVSPPTAPVPEAIQFAPSAPSTIARAPLLPPPEFAV